MTHPRGGAISGGGEAMIVRYTRDVSDWVLVIRALEIMGADGLVERIREVCRTPGTSRRALDAQGRDIDALDLAVSMADTDRPAHFPPVAREVLP